MNAGLSYHGLVHHAARDYAAAGKPVFPVWGIIGEKCRCGDPHCKNPGKHPHSHLAPKGKNSATVDPEIINAWFHRDPSCNIAMSTGATLGVAILDVDEGHGGYESIETLERQYGDLPAAHAVLSGGGGLHIYFANPIHQTIATSTALIGPGLDIRAQGGSIVLPPSIHASGRRYQWGELTKNGLGPSETFTPMPSWLIALTTKPAESLPVIVPSRHLHLREPGTGNDRNGPIPGGQRNATLASRSGAMRRAGFCESEILAVLIQMNQDRCHPPLPEREVHAIAKSVARYAPAPAVSGGNGQQFRGLTIRDGRVIQ